MFSIGLLVIFLNSRPSQAECQLSYATRTEITAFRGDPLRAEIRTLSRGRNEALKKSFDLANKLDRYTLGLVSALVLPAGLSFEDIRPLQWDQLKLSGTILYQDGPLSAVPLKAARVVLGEGHNSVELTTGADGQFSENLSKLVPYSRFRLFPAPIYERRLKDVPVFKIPFTIKIQSKFCQAQTQINEMPIDPIVFVASPTNH